MQSHYEIIVSKAGVHLFATAERSCVGISEMKRVYGELVNAFPEKAGFKIEVIKWEVIGHTVRP